MSYTTCPLVLTIDTSYTLYPIPYTLYAHTTYTHTYNTHTHITPYTCTMYPVPHTRVCTRPNHAYTHIYNTHTHIYITYKTLTILLAFQHGWSTRLDDSNEDLRRSPRLCMHLALCKIHLYDCIYISTTQTATVQRPISLSVRLTI